jgi:alpha-glucosidase (family GH31 glycosyl hydrolase)
MTCHRAALSLVLILCFAVPLMAQSNRIVLELEEGEYWWGGLSVDGNHMPYGEERFSRDLYGDNGGNQAQPLLISSHGRFVWSEQPIAYTFDAGKLTVTSGHGPIASGQPGKTLKDAYAHVSKSFFPPQGTMPEPLMFTAPQYNTWIELMYDQNEADILAYAEALVDQGYPSGVLMIDDNWQTNYGNWEFSALRFKQPKAMMGRLHRQGFQVMLWICPFVSPDSTVFRDLAQRGLLLLDKNLTPEVRWGNNRNNAAIIRWWNGASGLLDLSNPKAREWFQQQLDHLVNTYGVDGFKLDAGDANFYRGPVISFQPSLPNDHTTYFAQVGLKYPLNEYRASWKMAGEPLAQRLRDKRHNWEDLQKLVPGILAQGLMGYAFTCPDLIGGGEFSSFLNLESVDPELMVRSAQCSALMPMMQFSVAPWRVLDAEHAELCRRAALLHEQVGEEILALAKASADSGEPIARHLAYEYPGRGYETVRDQFLLGPDVLVAPVVNKGARSRKIIFPPGTWTGEDGSVVIGPATREVDAPLDRLPWYRRSR